MSFTGSGGGGAMPPSRILALLQSLQGDPSGGAVYPSAAYPQSRRPFGLFGGQYDAYMKGTGARESTASGAFDPYESAASGAQQNPKLASNEASCPSCHGRASSPPPPPVAIPPPDMPTWPTPPGMDWSLLPPPLSGIGATGWLAGILSGPQKSEYRRSGRSPPPPGAGDRPDEWSDDPECNRQFQRDRQICQSIETKSAKGACWASQMERLRNCNKGRPDFPPLLGW